MPNNRNDPPVIQLEQRRQRLVTGDVAAQYLSISTVSLWRLVKAHDLVPVRLGRSVRFDMDDLDAYIANLKVQQAV